MASGHTRRTLLPFPTTHALRLGIWVIILMSAGCAKPQMHGPPLIPAPADPALEVQARLLRSAQADYDEKRYESASLLLHRLIAAYPQSPLQPEARWWLARSYDQQGEWQAALEQYRFVALHTGNADRARRAKLRITELDRIIRALPHRLAEHLAVLLPADRLPLRQDLDGWVRELAETGVTTVMLEAGGPLGARTADGVPFRSHDLTAIRDAIGRLAPVAHRQGVTVYAAMSPRRMYAPDTGADWKDRFYDPLQGRTRPSEFLDLFHPSVQQYLAGLCSDFARAGVDGILFRADAPLGPMEGFSASALSGFERDFGITLEPASLYLSAGQVASLNEQAPRPPDQATSMSYAPEFWRWTGWKSRESLKILDRIRLTARAQAPALRVILEVHAESVTDPVQALVRYGEDLQEAKRLRFDSYLFAPEGEQRPSSRETLSRAVAVIGEAHRIWAAIPLPAGESGRLRERLQPASDRAARPDGIGLIYVEEPRAVP